MTPLRTDVGAHLFSVDHCGRLPLALAYADVPLRDTVEAVRRTGAGVNQAFASPYRELSGPAAHLFRALAPTLEPGHHVTAEQAADEERQLAAFARCLLDELH